jgi:hypothetical protein
MLFYADGPAERPTELTADARQAVIAEYVAWGENLPAGSRIDGARLSSIWEDPGRVLTGHGDSYVASDGPFAETHEVVGGYGIIDAASYADAVALCRPHPHLKHGRIIIRQLA